MDVHQRVAGALKLEPGQVECAAALIKEGAAIPFIARYRREKTGGLDEARLLKLKEKIEESREFASDVQQSLHTGLSVKNAGIRDRGVKKAPFVVLIGANMPSILAEISFVSNPADEHRLQTSDYRQRIAESLYRGIARYADGLSGVKVASKLAKASGQ